MYSAISKQLKTVLLNLYMQMLRFIIMNQILNNVIINEDIKFNISKARMMSYESLAYFHLIKY